MKTITTNAFTWEELSEQTREKIIEKHYDINICHDWYEFVYVDAENIGCEISAFDLGRRNMIDFSISDLETTITRILANHGETCETYKLAVQYNNQLTTLETNTLDDYDYNCEYTELEKALEYTLGEEYISMLRREYDYLTSREAIKETIIANEYTFDLNGNII